MSTSPPTACRRAPVARWLAPWAALWLAVGGCASTGAPKGWLPKATEVGRDPFGAWITVTPVSRAQPAVGGELIAVAADSVHVLTEAGLVTLPLAAIAKARVAYCDPETHNASDWVALGTVSTLSHGWLLAISAPIWLIVGSQLAGTQSRSSLVDFPDHDWPELGRHARFPQGLPPQVDRTSLAPRSHGRTGSTKESE